MPYSAVGELIVINNDGTAIPFCSGSMLDQMTILSAAHCFIDIKALYDGHHKKTIFQRKYLVKIKNLGNDKFNHIRFCPLYSSSNSKHNDWEDTAPRMVMDYLWCRVVKS